MADSVKQYLHNDQELLRAGGRMTLATSCMVVTGFAAGISVLLLLDDQDKQGFYIKLVLTLLLSTCCITSLRWRSSFMECTDSRPDHESWRLAKHLIKQHAIPFWPLVIALTVVCSVLVAASVVAAFTFLNMNSYVAVLLWFAATVVSCLVVFLGGMRAARSLARIYFPDRPYVWATPRGINVEDKVFVDWSRVEQIDVRWEFHKGRYNATGAVIWSDAARASGKTIVPLMNATIEVIDAVAMMRHMANENGITLPEQAAPNARPVKPPSDRDWKRAYRKSPELRKMLLDQLDALPSRIAEVEKDIANLPMTVAEYENEISAAGKSKMSSLQNLQRMKQMGGLKQYPDFEQTVQKSLALNDASIRSYQQMIDDVPRRKSEMEQHLVFLSDTLADYKEKQRRYIP